MTQLGEWLRETLAEEGLSLRQAAAKTGLSHSTIAEVMKGGGASPQTIRKLARAFGGNGRRGWVLQDKLLTLAGHRTDRLREQLTEPAAELLDITSKFNAAQLRLMVNFADFLTKIKE